MNLSLYGSRKPLHCSFCICVTVLRSCRVRRRWDGLAPRLRYRHVRSLMTDCANEKQICAVKFAIQIFLYGDNIYNVCAACGVTLAYVCLQCFHTKTFVL